MIALFDLWGGEEIQIRKAVSSLCPVTEGLMSLTAPSACPLQQNAATTRGRSTGDAILSFSKDKILLLKKTTTVQIACK